MSRLSRASSTGLFLIVPLLLVAVACGPARDISVATPVPVATEATSTVPASPTVAPAPTTYTVSTGLENIRFAYDRFLEMFFRPLQPKDLLLPAWEGVRNALAAAGVPAADLSPPSPPNLDPDVEAAWGAFRDRYDEVARRYGDRVGQQRLAHAAIRAMAAGLQDCHTGFVSPEQFAAQRRGGGYVGIGVSLRPADGGYPVVLEVYPDSPAARAGLHRGDTILSLDGQDLAGMPQESVSDLIRGPAGSVLELTIRRPGQTSPLDVQVVRGEVRPPVMEKRMLDGKIGYMRFYSFGAGLLNQFNLALEEFLRDGVKGLIIDVRSNPGGSGADRVLSKFVPSGDLYYFTDRKGGRHVGRTDGSYIPGLPPLVVLVNEGSASAAELFAAAAQDFGIARVVGSPTRGCLATVEQVPLPDQSAIRVTTQGVVLGKSGRDVTNVGVTPDETVELRPEDLAAGRDAQLDRAISLLRTP